MENIETLQDLADTIEGKILQAGGSIAVASHTSSSPFLEDANNALGEAMTALIKLKEELGLHSSLSGVSSIVS